MCTFVDVFVVLFCFFGWVGAGESAAADTQQVLQRGTRLCTSDGMLEVVLLTLLVVQLG